MATVHAHRSLILAGLLLSCIAATRAAEPPAPFAHGNPQLGKPMVERDCVACHAQRMAGDAEKMYLRGDHRVRTPQQLLAQVSYCNTQLGTNYFPDDEEHVAAYLNAQYYHFPP